MRRPRGRPRLNEAEKRSEPVGVRLTKSLRKQLDEAARAENRTLTQEIERRLQRSFGLDQEKEGRFGSAGTYWFLRLVARGVANIEHRCSRGEPSDDERRWMHDRFTFDQVAAMIDAMLTSLRPSGERRKPKVPKELKFGKRDRTKYDYYMDHVGRDEAMLLLTGVRRALEKDADLSFWFGRDTAAVLRAAAYPLRRRIKNVD